MGRSGRVVTVVIVVVLAATSAWAVSQRSDLQSRVRALEDALQGTNERLDVAGAARRDLAVTLAERVKTSRKKASSLETRLYGARLDVRRLRAMTEALSRSGKEVFETKLLAGSDFDLLAVEWHRSTGGTTLSGIDVWRVPAREEVMTASPSWELAYVTEPAPSFDPDHPSYVVYGPPGAPTREAVEFVQMIDISDAGDATGDGWDDLAIQELGSGSGGCGYVKLLQNVGDTLRETYRHEGCNHSLEIENGRLILGQAWHPRGCDQIHGCGRRARWMRWTGSSWVTTDVRRAAY